MAKKPLDTTRLSDSRLKLVLKEMEGRTHKMKLGLRSTFKDHINELQKRHNVPDLLEKLRLRNRNANKEKSELSSKAESMRDEAIRIKSDEKEIIHAKWAQKKSDIKAKYLADIEAVNKRENNEIERYLNRKNVLAQEKRVNAAKLKVTEVNDKIELIGLIISSITSLQNSNGNTKYYAEKAIKDIGEIDFSSVKNKDTTTASKYFTDVAKALVNAERSDIEIVSIMDDLRANLICAGSSTGVESLIKSLPTASALAKMSFSDLHKSVVASGNQLAQITA